MRGRGTGPGRGTGAGAAGGSPGGYAVAHGGVGGGKLFGRGQEAVAYDREKEKGVLKVGGLGVAGWAGCLMVHVCGLWWQ